MAARGFLCLVFTLLLCACGPSAGSDNAGPTQDALARLELPTAPEGYRADNSLSGPMDINTAATSTPGAAGDTRAALTAQSFSGAASRVWRSGDDYVTDYLFAFDKQSGAAAFEQYLIGTVTDNPAAYKQPLAVPSQGTEFFISARNKTRTRFIFCEGATFSADVYAALIETCGAQPNNNRLVEDLAKRQYQRIVGALFTVPSSTPPP